MLLVCRALALERTHSSSFSSIWARLASFCALDLEAVLLGLEVGRVVALVGVGLAAVELEDPLGDVVEEVPVVGDGQDGAGVRRQVVLQPLHRLGVEVVGGLVEQQQVGLLEQQLAQRDAAALTTGEVVDEPRRRGGQRSASMAWSSRLSRSHALAWSSSVCRSPVSVATLSWSASGSPIIM